jgi:hypothetical protein
MDYWIYPIPGMEPTEEQVQIPLYIEEYREPEEKKPEEDPDKDRGVVVLEYY